MTMGTETIELLPFKNWGQLDVHKWGVRGRLPATPAGLEITPDHVKIAGETVSINDAEGCSKLERIFNEWIAFERATLELTRKKSVSKPSSVSAEATTPEDRQPLRYHVELDHERQVHIRCGQGKNTIAEIGLTLPGLRSLVSQGLMHKPRNVKVGALHDWVELDGTLYSFEKGNNDSDRLEKALNERYLSHAALGQGKEVVVFTNAASSTGFDILFTATLGGTPDRRRRPLNEETLELLQDPNRCGLLHKGLVIKMTRPALIFKRKTPDGGERYLETCQENTVIVTGDDGDQKAIDLSQAVNYLHLSAVELTAVFNHPAINQHSKASPKPSETTVSPAGAYLPEPAAQALAPTPPPPTPPKKAEDSALPVPSKPALERPASQPVRSMVNKPAPEPVAAAGEGRQPSAGAPVEAAPSSTDGSPFELWERSQKSPPFVASEDQPGSPTVEPAVEASPRPNSWLEPLLAQPPIRYDWFARLVYCKLARKFGNSREGQFGPNPCWDIALSPVKDIADPSFDGIFLTEKGGLGFLNHGHMARFYKSVAFVGTEESALEGIDVNLGAVGLDSDQRIVFIVSDDYLTKFGVAAHVVSQELNHLKTYGAVVLSRKEALQSPDPIELLWTVPADQPNPADPQALETTRPIDSGAEPPVTSSGRFPVHRSAN